MPNPGGISTAPKLWLKADAGVYKDAGSTLAADGESVQQWNDQSASGNNATQATSGNRPVYKTSIVNGQPVIRFTAASSHFLSLPNLVATLNSGAGEVFVVVKINADPPATDNKCGLMHLGDTGLSTLFPYTDGILYDGTASNARKTTGDPVTSLATWVIYNVSSSSGDWTSRINGSTHFNTATNGCAFSAVPVIGGSQNGLNFLDGDFAELIAFDAVLSGGTDRTDVYNYLHSKYVAAAPSLRRTIRPGAGGRGVGVYGGIVRPVLGIQNLGIY